MRPEAMRITTAPHPLPPTRPTHPRSTLLREEPEQDFHYCLHNVDTLSSTLAPAPSPRASPLPHIPCPPPLSTLLKEKPEDEKPKAVVRPYTPTSPPDAKGYMDLVVKVYPQVGVLRV